MPPVLCVITRSGPVCAVRQRRQRFCKLSMEVQINLSGIIAPVLIQEADYSGLHPGPFIAQRVHDCRHDQALD
jgi:hypothetical protein